MRSQQGRTEPSYEEIKTVQRLEEVLHREEIQWLAEGDKNTRFFHLRASQRKKKNRVAELSKSDGTVTTDEGEMGSIANSFYQNLYSSEGVSGMDEALRCVPTRVYPAMNRKLNSDFEAKEVKTPLFEMYPTKLPGPDGFPA
jgi:hypothetical protein